MAYARRNVRPHWLCRTTAFLVVETVVMAAAVLHRSPHRAQLESPDR